MHPPVLPPKLSLFNSEAAVKAGYAQVIDSSPLSISLRCLPWDDTRLNPRPHA